MVSLDNLSIGLVLSCLSILFVLGMIFFHVYYEKIKEYCFILSKKINKIVENKTVNSSPNERVGLMEDDLEGFELV